MSAYVSPKESIYISREDVRILTGCAIKANQIAYLKDKGIAFRVNACGWPNVTVIEATGGHVKQQKEPQKWQSNVMKAA
jgi:hypothetical protein